MMRAVLMVVLLALAASASAGLRRVEASVHASSVWVTFPERGNCTSTNIDREDGRTTLMLATHCLAAEVPEVVIQGERIAVTRVVRFPGDIAEITVDKDLGPPAVIGPTPRQGDEVFIFGNPAPYRDILRRGYICGTHDGLLLAQLPAWKGDSGAAVFNERGQVVGVVVSINLNQWFEVTALQPLPRRG